MRPPARAGRGTGGTGSAAGRRTRFPRPKGRTPPVRQTETIAARTRIAPGSRAREGRTTAWLSERRTSRVRAPRRASPRSPAARSAGRTSTCGRDVRFGSRIERTPPASGPPPTNVSRDLYGSSHHLVVDAPHPNRATPRGLDKHEPDGLAVGRDQLEVCTAGLPLSRRGERGLASALRPVEHERRCEHAGHGAFRGEAP